MKITVELPDSTKAIVISYAFTDGENILLSSTNVDTVDLLNAANLPDGHIKCKGCEQNDTSGS
jgi:hypothetical protein